MSHWLEEAEREEQRKKQRPADESARIQDKKFRIAKNYEANKEAYKNFVDTLFDLCERANNLPMDKRIPWGQIDFKVRETRYENHFVSVSSSEPFDKTIMIKSFPFVKKQHYKHVHKIYISISKEMGKAEIEVRNDYLAKTRLRTDEKKEEEIMFDDGLPRVKLLFLYEISKLDRDLAYKILDWLAFKEELKSLPFREEHFKYPHGRK